MTYVIILINILVFSVEILLGGSTNTNVLIFMGAKVNELIAVGQYWRFLTPMFLHIGYMHIFVNMISLKNTGPFIEKFIGRLWFIIIYIFSGMTGNIMSYFFSSSISAGASTSIFGIIGSVCMCGIFYRSNNQVRAVGWNMWKFALANLAINIFQPGIDLFGHLGGFLGGCLITTIILLFKTSSDKKVVEVSK